MQFIVVTATCSSNDYYNCSTGCPLASCSNPFCPSRSTGWSSNSCFYTLPAEKLYVSYPAWLVEQRQTPRQMKRGLPAYRPQRLHHVLKQRRLPGIKSTPTAGHRMGLRKSAA